MNNFILIFLFSFYNHYSLCNDKTSLLDNKDEDISFLQGVYGDSYSYFTILYLGKEKINQTYILDTGSYVTTSPCDKCLSCEEHLNPKYKLKDENRIIPCNSQICNKLSNVVCLSNQCSFIAGYGEGTIMSGLYVKESIFFEETVKENISYNIPIGCTTREEGNIVKSQVADGIMGLGNNNKSFVDILYNSKVIKRNIFSLCLSHEVGYLSIGKIDTSYHFSKNINYVNLIDLNLEFYYIKLNYIQVGKKKIEYNSIASIDSGTSLTYFPNKIFNLIMKQYLKICKNCGNLRRIEQYGYCAKVKNLEEMNEIAINWKDIIIALDGYKFIWKPENYLFVYETEEGELNLCLGFEGEDREKIVLGITFMHGFDIIFDKEKFRIGIVPADCERNKTILEEEENDNDIIENSDL